MCASNSSPSSLRGLVSIYSRRVKTKAGRESPRPGLKGPWVKGGGSARTRPDDSEKSSSRGCPNNGISTRRLQYSYVRRRLQKLASSPPIGNSSNRKQLRAWSFWLRTRTSQRIRASKTAVFTGRLTSLDFFYSPFLI